MKENKPSFIFPFTAIVGQEDLKLALLLNTIDPLIGGVLAIGDKGTGKTTLIRSLAHLMSHEERMPFVNLPIGSTEDRVLGHVQLGKLINEKKEIIEKGLLAKAHQGFLYIDEINLLNDYLMDILLDAAATGEYQLEREGISQKVKSRFCLVGSMNPEEGNLRPQLKDRFGLCVHVKTPQVVEERVKIIQNRIQFDAQPAQFITEYQNEEYAIWKKIQEAKKQLDKITYSTEIMTYCATCALQHQVEGLRADIILLKTARALTAYLNDDEITTQHVDQVLPFVIEHRSHQSDARPPQQKKEEDKKDENHSSALNPDQDHTAFQSILPENETPKFESKKGKVAKGDEIKAVDLSLKTSQKESGQHQKIDVRKTARQYLATDQFDVQFKKSASTAKKHLIFILDSSGSMAHNQAVAYSKGLIEKTVVENQYASILFSLVYLYNGEPHVIQGTSKEVEVLTHQLQEIKTGGKTMIVPVFKKVKELIAQELQANPTLIMLTDGRFSTSSQDQTEDVVTAFNMYCKAVEEVTVIDAENSTVKIGGAKAFAEKIKAHYQPLLSATI